jgi:hypothetical protein
MDVAIWLWSLGLEQYEAAFFKNEIDDSVLPDLTEDHLELGFPLGARLKILKAVGGLRPDEVSTRSTDRSIESAALSVTAGDYAERRQVTVLFSDLVGSTVRSKGSGGFARGYLGLHEVRCASTLAQGFLPVAE